jgi:hypothetical protein
MKTVKPIAALKTGTANCGVRTRPCSLTIGGLEELCDDPARNESGQEVQAVLTPHDSGYLLTVRDGRLVYKILNQRGRQMKFRSIDQALDTLSDVPHLLPEVAINVAQWSIYRAQS